MFSIISRALITFGFVWLMMPHQPDLGLGRPAAIETSFSDTSAKACATNCGALGAVIGAAASIENSRDALFANIARVRSDLRANGTQIGALSRNGAP
ncbi:MAG: hypothetical protein WDM86_22225 [Rhizomicrobium sp.]